MKKEQIKESREVPDEAREVWLTEIAAGRYPSDEEKAVLSDAIEVARAVYQNFATRPTTYYQAASLIHQYLESRQPTGLVQQEAGSGAVLSEVGSAGASGQVDRGSRWREIILSHGENNEATGRPFWFIACNAGGAHSGREVLIRGIWFNREDAEAHLKAKAYNYPKTAYVFCASGNDSEHMRELYELARSPQPDLVKAFPCFPQLWKFLFAAAGQGLAIEGIEASDLCQQMAESASPDAVIPQMDEWNALAAMGHVRAEASTTPTGVSLQVDKEREK